MGLVVHPEIKLALRIIKKHSLKIPIDFDTLVSEYANLIYKHIPIEGVDGVSLNLKVPGKRPTIVIDSNLPKTRQLFTLAHEFGHVIIPWHLGTIVDEFHSEYYNYIVYSELEQEANRFAAELLMPGEWILSEFNKCNFNLSLLHENVVKLACVSDQAAAIRLVEKLPPHIIYIAEKNGKVIHSGKTALTHLSLQEEGSRFDNECYPYFDTYIVFNAGSTHYHWWKLSTKIEINVDGAETWREILDKIVQTIQPPMGNDTFKKSINGIIAHANGKCKGEEDYSIDSVVSACIYRLRRSDLKDLVSHPDFEKFVKVRVLDFFK